MEDDLEAQAIRLLRKLSSGKTTLGVRLLFNILTPGCPTLLKTTIRTITIPLSICFAITRIHFALNCGAKSCPPIRIYKEDRSMIISTAKRCSYNSPTQRSNPDPSHPIPRPIYMVNGKSVKHCDSVLQ